MIDRDRNRKINAALSTLYERYSAAYLTAYIKAFRDENPPERINEFGIIDEERYDADNGILFVAKETNDWDNKDAQFASTDCPFRMNGAGSSVEAV